MKPIDEASSPDIDLDRFGSAIRTQSARHPGNLGDLERRARSRQTRRRLMAVTAVSVAVLVAVVATGARRTGTGSTEVSVAGPVDTAAPTWTVNNSVVLRHGTDTWAVEVVFDPSMWTFDRFVNEPYLAQSPNSPGMAQYGTEPRLEVYWEGDQAHESAIAAQAALQGQPGIVSVEVGQALEASPPHPGPT